MATGTRQEFFHSVGTFTWVRLRFKRWARIVDSWLAQVLSAFGLIPSGPAALPWWSLSSCLLTFPVVKASGHIEGGGMDPESSQGRERKRGGGYQGFWRPGGAQLRAVNDGY